MTESMASYYYEELDWEKYGPDGTAKPEPTPHAQERMNHPQSFLDAGPQEFNRYGDGQMSAPTANNTDRREYARAVAERVVQHSMIQGDKVIDKETAASLERQAARLLARADEMRAKYARFGEDDYPVGAVITFDKTFNHYNGRPLNRVSKPYFYAAIKDPTGRWSTTGPRAPKSYTWDELIQWMGDGVQEIYYVTKLERVV